MYIHTHTHTHAYSFRKSVKPAEQQLDMKQV